MALRRRSKRSWLPALVIIVVGVTITWWATARDQEQAGEIETMVRHMILTVATDGSIESVCEYPYIAGEVETRIRTLLMDVPDPGVFRVTVISGDVEGYGESRATHRAIISIGDLERLGLRVSATGKTPVVLGYFER